MLKVKWVLPLLLEVAEFLPSWLPGISFISPQMEPDSASLFTVSPSHLIARDFGYDRYCEGKTALTLAIN